MHILHIYIVQTIRYAWISVPAGQFYATNFRLNLMAHFQWELPITFCFFFFNINDYYWIGKYVQNHYIGVCVGGREPNISWNDNLETYPWLTVPWQKFHALKIGLGTRHLFIHRKLESFSPFPSLDSKLLSREVFEGLLVNWTHWGTRGHGGGASFNCCSFLLLDIVDSIITGETGQHDVQHFVIHSCIFPYKAWKLEK